MIKLLNAGLLDILYLSSHKKKKKKKKKTRCNILNSNTENKLVKRVLVPINSQMIDI